MRVFKSRRVDRWAKKEGLADQAIREAAKKSLREMPKPIWASICSRKESLDQERGKALDFEP